MILLLAILFDVRPLMMQPICEHVDLMELNHKYDKNGKHTFTQVIFWERLPQNGRYRVRDWVISDERESLDAVPVFRHGLYESHFVKNGIYYHVRSPLFRQSWTMNDPEVEDGKTHPKHLRVPLRTPIDKNID